MSKKRIIALITVIVLLFAAAISVGVFLYGRGESEAVDGSQTTDRNDGNQVPDGNQTTEGTQTGVNDNQQTTNPDADDNEIVDNNTTAGNTAGNGGITTDTNVNNVGETTITRVEQQEKLVSEHFLDWWKPMQVNVNSKTLLGVKTPQLTVKKSAITTTGTGEFVYAGQNITYVIKVTNNSDVEIKNIEITDKIPQGTSFEAIADAVIEDEVVAEGKAIEKDNAIAGVKWVVTIPAGETVDARFTVKVTATEGTISNIAIANGEESTDPTKDPEDPDTETKTAIINSNKSSVLTRNDETIESKIAKVGDLITYTISVENTGAVDGTTFITDIVPTGTEFVTTPEIEGLVIAEDKTSIVWSIDVPAGETITREFTVKVTSVDNGTINNTAKVGGSDITDPNPIKVEANIIFVENGGTTVTDMTGFAGKVITNTTMPETTRTGYTFKGWYDNSELTGDAVQNLPAAYPTGTTYYYAKWEANAQTYTVNYLEKGTDKVLKQAVTKDTKFDAEIKGVDEKVEITGYTYDSVNPEKLIVTNDNTKNIINVYYTANAQTYTVNYLEKGTGKVLKEAVTKDTKFDVEIKGVDEKVEITGYTYDSVNPEKLIVTNNNEANVINVYYKPMTNIKYIVEYYYEVKGEYPKTATNSVEREGTTGTKVSVTDFDKKPEKGYAYDTDATNIESGIVAADGSLVLKLYFKQQFIVTYKDGVNGEVFKDKVTSGLDYGDATPVLERIPIRKGYTFVDWTPEIALEVTEDATYTATWIARNDTPYVVEHYQQNLDGTYTKVDADTENKTGTTGTIAQYQAKTYTGFTYKEEKTTPTNADDRIISANGGLVIKLYYDRNIYNYTIKYYFNMEEDANKRESGTAKYGQKINAEVDNYSSAEWTLNSKESTVLPYEITETENLIEMFYEKPEIIVKKTSAVASQDGKVIINDNNHNQITYTITATNNGYLEGTVTIADTKPQGTVLVSEITVTGYDTNPTEEDLADGITLIVPARESVQIQFTVKVTDILPGVSVENTPIVNGQEDETNKVENIVEKTINVKSKAETIKGTNIVIVIDLSASMNDIINGVSKLEAAKDAAQAFISKIFENGANGTQVSIVTFNFSEEDKNNYRTETDPKYVGTKVFTYELDGATKTIVTNQAEATAMNAEIEKIQLESNLGTNMSAGLNKADEQLNVLKELNSSNENVIIFLGDGNPDEDQEEDIELKSTEIKNAGTEIYTIGFGLSQELDQFCCYTTWLGILVPFNCTLETPIPKEQHTTITTIFGNIHHHKTTVYEEEAIKILRDMASGETEAEKDKYAKSSTDANSLIDTFEAISRDIAETDEPIISENGLIELEGVYVDSTHPITITIDEEPPTLITALPTQENDITGPIILVIENGESKYYLNLAKFALGSEVSIEYFAE